MNAPATTTPGICCSRSATARSAAPTWSARCCRSPAARKDGAREVAVQPLVDDVARIARDTLPKNIAISATVAPTVPAVVGDATQFHQVLLNLCVNARDAMPDGGRLTIAADTVTLPAESEPLLRGHAGGHLRGAAGGRHRPGHRAGRPSIGSSIRSSPPRRRVRARGSDCRRRSRSSGTMAARFTSHSEPGRGTRFRVYLPAHARTPSARCRRSSRPLPRGHGETILVVDDEPEIRAIIRQVLESAGYRVLLAVDGVEGAGALPAAPGGDRRRRDRHDDAGARRRRPRAGPGATEPHGADHRGERHRRQRSGGAGRRSGGSSWPSRSRPPPCSRHCTTCWRRRARR